MENEDARSSLEREEGFYWVAVFDELEVAKYTTSSGEWTIAGFSEAIEVHPSEIGPKIEPPEHEHTWKPINEKLSTCQCGALLVMHGAFTDEELKKMEEQMRVPVRILRHK